MIILDATNKLLEVVLGGAVSTNQLPVVTSYVDITTTTYTPGSNDTATNSTTDVTIVAAPAASTQRVVKLITVKNEDTAVATVTIKLKSGGTDRIIVEIALPVDATLIYTDGEGFRVIDSNGNIKTAMSGMDDYILKSLADAHSVLYAISDNTPAALAVAASRIVGRKSSGNIVALTGAELLAILTGQAGAAFDWGGQNLTNLGTLAAFTTAGIITLGEYAIDLDETLSADGKYCGITCQGVYGATLAYGDLIYLAVGDQRWEKTDADAEATAGDVMLGIALESGNDGDSKLVFLWGFIRDDSWNFTSYGDTLYVSTTLGAMTQTRPSASADIVRAVGFAHDDADTIFFCPSPVWIEIA